MDGSRRKIRCSKIYRMKNSAPKLKQNLMVVSYATLCYAMHLLVFDKNASKNLHDCIT